MRLIFTDCETGGLDPARCAKHPPRFRDIRGVTFGRLLAIEMIRLKRGVTTWSCRCQCGSTVLVAYGHLVTGHTQSCGCLNADASSARMAEFCDSHKKEQHPRWNPDLTAEDRAKNRTEEDKRWSREVMSRDGFRCVVCGHRGVLNSHHLQGYARCPADRLRLGNGVALCEACHKRFHKASSYTEFSRDDFFTIFGLDDPGDDHEFIGVPMPTDGMAANVVKYVARYKLKGGVEDLKKAAWYLARLIEVESKGGAR